MNTETDRTSFMGLRSGRHIALGILTVCAGVIRFFDLSHPCLWFDEAMVFWRTCGTYGQLLDCLRTDGFVPLHYSLAWFLSQHFRPTPFMFRFVPAVCGTLMVPAVYFLARQMLPIGTALLAAGLAMGSGFLIFYSRDAKMYMEAWLFVTLNMGCLLWWFRSASSTAWLSWIASGCAACGIHFSSAIPVLLSLLLLFTQSRMRWQQMMLWLVGILVIFSGPVGYYEQFNRWADRVDEDGWQESGLQWIGAYNYGRTDLQLVRLLGTSTLMGWEWPKDSDLKSLLPWRVIWPERAAEALLGVLVAGCLPWPRRFHSGGAQPQWRVMLWLCFWIVLPAYGFYCRSVPGFQTPMMLYPYLRPTRGRVVLLSAFVAAVIGLLVRYPQMRAGFYRWMKSLMVVLAVLGLCQLIGVVAANLSKAATEKGVPWQSLWVPRYIGFIWPALAIAVAGLIMRLPTKYVRWVAICFVLGINLTTGALRIFAQTEPPVDRMAMDSIAGQTSAGKTVTWMHIKRGMQFPGSGNLLGGSGQYYVDMLRSVRTTPTQFRTAMRLISRPGHLSPEELWRRPISADVSRIVAWDQYEVAQNIATGEPAEGWRLKSDELFTARDFWIWQDLAKYRRREYVRIGN